MTDNKLIASVKQIESKMFLIRGQKVMLDADLAELYGVQTKVLNQAVKRNIERFPEDFMFQLNAEEVVSLRRSSDTSSLRSQIVTSNNSAGRGGRRSIPYAFTEQGVSMLSSVLRSTCAIQVNIEIMRSFVRLRQMLASKLRPLASFSLTQTLSHTWARGQTNRFANFTLMLSFPANLLRWKRNTISNSKRYSKPSTNS
jgi:hypothetical protein